MSHKAHGWLVLSDLFRLMDDSGRETYTTGVESSISKSSAFINSHNSGSDGQLLVVWPVRSHKAHGGITRVGAVVGVAIAGPEVLLL